MADKRKHRGRIQAQGGGLEESETWAQEEPLTKEEGLGLLNRLRDRLSDKDRELRRKPFEEAERFIRNVEGGIDAPQRRTFLNRRTKDVRVDIEVWSGIAFMTITFLILAILWKLM